MKYIKFRIRSGQTDENGVTRRADIRMIESNMGMLECNELPIILNALNGSKELVVEKTKGFVYDFPIVFDEVEFNTFPLNFPIIF